MSVIKISYIDMMNLTRSRHISAHEARKILYKESMLAKISNANTVEDLRDLLAEFARELL